MNKKIKNLEKWDLPIGFTMALSENEAALKAFASLPKDKRELCIEKARSLGSKTEMQRLASDIASIEFKDFI